MPVTVSGPLLEGATGSTDNLGRPSIAFRYLVEGLEGTAESRIFAALTAAGIPATGDPYPDASLLAFMTGKTVEPVPDSPSKFYVDVSYTGATAVEPPTIDPTAPAVINIETNLQTVEVYEDVGGNPLKVSHEIKDKNGKVTSTEFIQATAQKQQPQTVITYSKSGLTDSLSEGLQFVGKLNQGSFAQSGTKRWLCTSIRSVSNDGGLTYQKTYQFQHDLDQWKVRIFYKDSKGNLPEDSEFGKEIKDFDIYDKAPFSGLNLT